MIRDVIVRIVRTRDEAPDTRAVSVGRSGAAGTDDERRRLARVAARVNGLETLVVGWRGGGVGGSARAPLAVVTAWRDAESMLAAIGADESAFLRDRLGLAVAVDTAEPYEVMSRTFGSLPAPTSVLRIVTMRAAASTGASLFELLRDIQARLTDRGLIASHVARRVVPEGIEAVVVAVWIDHRAIAAATGGRPQRPAFHDEIEPWVDDVSIESYDALEIAPRLPMSSGPPILVLDGTRRVVDLTPAAAAALGRTQDEAVGALVEDLASPGDREAGEAWRRRLEDPEGAGEAAWAVPSGGDVMIRWRLRRDAPVRGRHTILVRRRQEPEPTTAELDAALAEAFPPEPFPPEPLPTELADQGTRSD
jgi:PAS domain-containing protein